MEIQSSISSIQLPVPAYIPTHMSAYEHEYPRTAVHLLELYPELKTEIQEHDAIDDLIRTNFKNKTRIQTAYTNTYVKSLIDAFLMYNDCLKENNNKLQLSFNHLNDENHKISQILNQTLKNNNDLTEVINFNQKFIEELEEKYRELKESQESKELREFEKKSQESQKFDQKYKELQEKKSQELQEFEKKCKKYEDLESKSKENEDFRKKYQELEKKCQELEKFEKKCQEFENKCQELGKKYTESETTYQSYKKQTENDIHSLNLKLSALKKNNDELKTQNKKLLKENAKYEETIIQMTTIQNKLTTQNKETEKIMIQSTEKHQKEIDLLKNNYQDDIGRLKVTNTYLHSGTMKAQVNFKWLYDRCVRMNELIKFDLLSVQHDKNVIHIFESEENIVSKFNFLNEHKKVCDFNFLKNQYSKLSKLIDYNPMLIHSYNNIRKFLQKMETIFYFEEIKLFMLFINENVIEYLCENIMDYNLTNNEVMCDNLYQSFRNDILIHSEKTLVCKISICIIPLYSDIELKLSEYKIGIHTIYTNNHMFNRSQEINVPSCNLRYNPNIEKILIELIENSIHKIITIN